MKQNENKNSAWIMTIIFWIIGIITIVWGGIKNISNNYGIGLIIILLLPLLMSLFLSFNIKIPKLIFNSLTSIIYLLIVIAFALAYKFQNIIGFIIPLLVLILVAILAIFYALFKTWQSCEAGIYYFIDSNKKIKCKSFWNAFSEYYIYGITTGIIDMILAAIFN